MKHDWIVPDWPAPPGIRALITTRAGGASSGAFTYMNLGEHVGDDAADCRENRARLRSLLPAEPLWLHQVHGNTVVEAPAAAPGVAADGAVACVPGAVIGVLTADCLPVLLCDRQGASVGVAHAGWRGLAAGVIENTVAKMQVDPRQLLAYLGPAIGAGAYEVGDDVRRVFVAADERAKAAFADRSPGKYLADLYLLARQRLAKTGIMSVHGGGFCTFAESGRFYSYRRDGPTGRMASLIWIENL
jgi:YfiH family protein